MLNSTVTNENYIPERLLVVRQEGVVTDAIHSRVFLFGEIDMSRFKRQTPPLCGCGCGEEVRWHAFENRWNKFIYGHYIRINNPMNNPKSRAKVVGKNHHNYGKDKYAKEKSKLAPLCTCGCNQKVKWNKITKQWNKYVNFHMNKGKDNPNFGKQLSKATKQKLSISLSGHNNPMFGRKRPDITLRNILNNSVQCGSLNPAWKGGKSFEPYCHIWTDQEYKQSIRDRDNNE